MPGRHERRTRRSILKASGTVAMAALAGCIEGPGGSSIEEGTGYATFFTLADWGNQVAGEHFTFDHPVTVGEIGHGWDPDFEVLSEAAKREIFLYLDTPEFAWSQDLAATLSADHPEVAQLDLLGALPEAALLTHDDYRAESHEEYDEPADEDTFDLSTFTVGEFHVIDSQEEVPALTWHDGHWDGAIPEIPVDGSRTFKIHVEDSQGHVAPIGEDELFQVHVTISESADEEPVEITTNGDIVTIQGRETGETAVVFSLYANGELKFTSSPEEANISVVESVEHDHDVFHDPHVWTDPVLAIEMIEAIADTLGEVDPDHTSTYQSNAAEYIDEVEELHANLEALVEAAKHKHVILAGHNSFGYISHRHEIEFHTPVGVSPDSDVTLQDIPVLATIVEEHDIDTVLYDPFEAPDPENELPPAVEVLIEDTEVSKALPLSPLAGTNSPWQDAGYGWLEQWREINLPALKAALGVEQY